MERYMLALRNRLCSPAVCAARVILISMVFGLTPDGGSVLADAAKVETPTALIEVKVREGLLTVNAREAPLAHVLRVIGDKAGITVSTMGDLSTPVTSSFAGVSLDKAIRRLVGENSWMMIYGPSDADGRVSGPIELQVYANRAGDTGTAAVMQPTDIESDTTEPESSLTVFEGSITSSIARDLTRRAQSQDAGHWDASNTTEPGSSPASVTDSILKDFARQARFQH